MRRLEGDVFPSIGHKFIDDVTAADVRELVLVIEERGARDVAKRAQETIGQIFRYASPMAGQHEIPLQTSSRRTS